METTSVLIDGRQILVSELREFYHTYMAVSDPTEAEARRRRMLLSLEHTGNSIIHEITRPVGSTSGFPNKRRRTSLSMNDSSHNTQNGGATGPIPPPDR